MWKPRPGWVLIEKVETEERFAGSAIIVPVVARDRFARWQYAVLAQGGPILPDPTRPPKRPGTRTVVQPGDWVLTPPRKAMEIDRDLWLVQEPDLWAVVR